jgi:hypothetical protein
MTLSPAVADRAIVRLRAPTVTNRYGDIEADWSAATTLPITGCALQPASSTEFTDPSRTAITTRWNLFAPPGTDLRAGDRVDVDGTVYEVDGQPLEWSSPGGNLDHVAAVLQRVEG